MVQVAYLAVIERGKSGFGAFFPDLPGCVSAGDTVAITVANAKAALALHLAGMIEDGDSLPQLSDSKRIPADQEVHDAARRLITVDI